MNALNKKGIQIKSSNPKLVEDIYMLTYNEKFNIRKEK